MNVYDVITVVSGGVKRLQCKFHIAVMEPNGKIVRNRLAICKECCHVQKNKKLDPWKCKKCGCLLPCKARVRQEACPVDKWNAVTLTYEGEQQA
jgi:hypothetical protein